MTGKVWTCPACGHVLPHPQGRDTLIDCPLAVLQQEVDDLGERLYEEDLQEQMLRPGDD